MDILTLLRANIKSKKGAFAGIVILMIIISMLLTWIFSLRYSVKKSIDDAYVEHDIGNITLNIINENVSEELLSKVRNHPLVDHIATKDAILMNNHEIGGKIENQSWLIVELTDYVRKQFNDDFTAYEDKVRPLSPNGIYLTQGIATNTGCKTGDPIHFATKGGSYDFTIEGFVVEPVCGASPIGWKTVYVSPEAYARIESEVDSNPDTDAAGRVTIVYVYKKADCDLTDGQFAQRINKDTGVSDYAYASETATQMKYYTFIFTDITSSVMLVFAAILAVVVLIIMAHNISMTIEMSYTELGILKAEGFTKMRIRMLYLLQYVLAQALGAVAGVILALPLVKLFGSLFQPITGIIAESRIAWTPSIPIILALVAVSMLFIFLLTGKVGKVSPVRALTGESRDVHFDSLLTVPVNGKELSLSLAYRQLSSHKRRYLAAILIFAVLVFFMLSVNLMSSIMKSKKSLEAVGTYLCEITVRKKDGAFTDEELDRIDQTVREVTEVDKTFVGRHQYLAINGNKVMCAVYKDPSVLSIVKGRAALYDNEIIITEILSDLLDLKIGDTVTVSNKDKSEEFIVCGYYAYMNDVGKVFTMSEKGAKKLDLPGFFMYEASLTHPKEADMVGEVLKERFGETMQIDTMPDFSEHQDMQIITLASDAMRYTIYIFSVIFVLVVVSMICSKVFTQERRDLGIYKAIGFTSRKLRLMFALRFVLLGVIGAAIGIAMSVLLSGKLLNALLRSMGISNFVSIYSVETILIPLILLLGSSFLFAYYVSRKVKKVEIRELVIE